MLARPMIRQIGRKLRQTSGEMTGQGMQYSRRAGSQMSSVPASNETTLATGTTQASAASVVSLLAGTLQRDHTGDRYDPSIGRAAYPREDEATINQLDTPPGRCLGRTGRQC